MNIHQQSNGDYQVHDSTCNYGKQVQEADELGDYDSCTPAVEKAEQVYGNDARTKGGQVNGCYYCCNPCHTE